MRILLVLLLQALVSTSKVSYLTPDTDLTGQTRELQDFSPLLFLRHQSDRQTARDIQRNVEQILWNMVGFFVLQMLWFISVCSEWGCAAPGEQEILEEKTSLHQQLRRCRV